MLKQVAAIRLETYFLPVVLIVAACLRLYRLDSVSLWYDEIFQVLVARGSLLDTIFTPVPNAGGSPLDYVVTHLTYHNLGMTEGMLRLPSVLWGTLCVLVMYHLAKKLFDSPTAYLAAILVAILPLHIALSREVRYYILPVLLVLLGTYLLLRAVETNRRRWWFTYAVVMVLAFLAQIYALAPAALHGLWLLAFHRTRRIWAHYLSACLLMAVLYGPWLVYFFTSGTQKATWEPAPLHLISILGSFLNDMTIIPRLLAKNPTPDAIRQVAAEYQPIYFGGMILYLTLFGFGLYQLVRRRLPPEQVSRLALLYLLVGGGTLGIYVFDSVTGYPFAARQLVMYTPFLVLLGSAVYVQALPTSLRQKTGMPMIAVLIMVVVHVALFARPLSDFYNTSREDWRGLGRYFLQHVQPDDLVLATQPDHIAFYAPELSARMTRTFPTSQSEMDTLLNTYDRLWITFIDWTADRDEIFSNPFMAAWLERTATQELAFDDFHEDFIIYVYPPIAEP